jgi:hypothetical protein
MKTAIIHHPIYQKHDTGIGHPEKPKLNQAIKNALKPEKK